LNEKGDAYAVTSGKNKQGEHRIRGGEGGGDRLNSSPDSHATASEAGQLRKKETTKEEEEQRVPGFRWRKGETLLRLFGQERRKSMFTILWQRERRSTAILFLSWEKIQFHRPSLRWGGGKTVLSADGRTA